MTVKKTNRLLLWSVILTMTLGMMLTSAINMISNIGLNISGIIVYLVTLLIGLIMLKKEGTKFTEWLPYNVPLKIKSFLLIFVIFILIDPVNSMLCSIGGKLFGDTFTSLVDLGLVQSNSLFIDFINIVIIPTIFEEMFYRGFFYSGYKNGISKRTAIIMSSIIFGTMHMVSQQAVYAMIAGFVLALIRELTGTMWAGMWLHFLNNGQSLLLDLFDKINPNIRNYMPTTHYNFDTTTNTIILIVAFIIAVPLLYFILKTIAKIEGKEEEFKTFFKEEKKEDRQKLFTPALVFSLIIEGCVMIGMDVVMRFINNHSANIEKLKE